MSWDEVQDVEIRKFKPISEYGGWGIRYGKSGKAIIISGGEGLQLSLKSGKKILIGIKKVDELSLFLRNFKKS